MRALTMALPAVAFLVVGCTPRIEMWKADRLMVKGKWSEAIAHYQRIAQAHPSSKWAQRARMLEGCAQFRLGSIDEAERTLALARDLNPNGEWADDAEYYLARVRYRKGDLDGAREGFRRLLTAYGDDPKRSNCKALALEELEFLQKREER